jgi:hypothetical protein
VTSVRTPARRAAADHRELDRAIAEAEAGAIVVWRGEHLPFGSVPDEIARTSGRAARELLYASYVEALEALNPLRARRLAAWMAAGDTQGGAGDAAELAADAARLGAHVETIYYAALRRHLALIGIEQGDASEADLWHVTRGTEWGSWFGTREVARAITATGGEPAASVMPDAGWRAAEAGLAAIGPEAADPEVGEAVGRARASLAGSPEWLADEMRLDAEATAAFVDFAAFVRLWRLRRATALLTYEHRLYETDDAALQRAYYAGIVGHQTGVAVAEAGYLAAVPGPWASAADLRATILGAMLVESLEAAHGPRWWKEPASAELLRRVAEAPSRADAVALVGYDALDWRPALRQIRTRLIGEMSGYGGPNITTRAGTRKV